MSISHAHATSAAAGLRCVDKALRLVVSAKYSVSEKRQVALEEPSKHLLSRFSKKKGLLRCIPCNREADAVAAKLFCLVESGIGAGE